LFGSCTICINPVSYGVNHECLSGFSESWAPTFPRQCLHWEENKPLPTLYISLPVPGEADNSYHTTLIQKFGLDPASVTVQTQYVYNNHCKHESKTRDAYCHDTHHHIIPGLPCNG